MKFERDSTVVGFGIQTYTENNNFHLYNLISKFSLRIFYLNYEIHHPTDGFFIKRNLAHSEIWIIQNEPHAQWYKQVRYF